MVKVVNSSGSPTCTQYGLPETSIAAWARVSSIGTQQSPNRRMPCLSPSASRMAWPSTIAVSSTVWWASMCTSPSARTRRSSEPCTPNAVSMWS